MLIEYYSLWWKACRTSDAEPPVPDVLLAMWRAFSG